VLLKRGPPPFLEPVEPQQIAALSRSDLLRPPENAALDGPCRIE